MKNLLILSLFSMFLLSSCCLEEGLPEIDDVNPVIQIEITDGQNSMIITDQDNQPTMSFTTDNDFVWINATTNDDGGIKIFQLNTSFGEFFDWTAGPTHTIESAYNQYLRYSGDDDDCPRMATLIRTKVRPSDGGSSLTINADAWDFGGAGGDINTSHTHSIQIDFIGG